MGLRHRGHLPYALVAAVVISIVVLFRGSGEEGETVWRKGDVVDVHSEVQAPDGSWKRQWEEAVVHRALPGGGAYVLFRDSKDPYLADPPYIRRRGAGTSPPVPNKEELQCTGPLEHVELWAQHVVKWGEHHHTATPELCCQACLATRGGERPCDTWVYCNEPTGCGQRKHKECWLKAQDDPTRPPDVADSGHLVGWWSGQVLLPSQIQRRKKDEADRAATRASRRDDPRNPSVWLEVAINGTAARRIHMVLYAGVSPRAAENFRGLFAAERLTGEKFYRILDRFIDQTGARGHAEGSGMTDWNAGFDDDPGGLKLRHDRKGLLSVANLGANTTTSHFSILMGPAPHLDGKYVIFGEVVGGMDVVDDINKLASSSGSPTGTALIAGSGCMRNCQRNPSVTPRAQ